MPKRFDIWFSPIMNAAADVNPLIMGRDKKFTTNPALRKPSNNWMLPIINARPIANSRYLSEPIAAMALKPTATRSESIATGPTDNCLDVPVNA